MNIFQSALACGGIAQVPHIEFTGKVGVILGISCVGELFGRECRKSLLHRLEYFGDGIRAFGFLTKHILISRSSVEFHAGNTCSFLSAVVLFFHHEV